MMQTTESNAQLPYGFARAFNVMAKPIGAVCNLDCTYCYYLHKEQLLGASSGSRMKPDLLEEFVRQYIEGQDVDSVMFSWHGGEPTLMGLDFFRRVVELQAKYANGKTFINNIQTNGVLIDENWCEFFAEHRFIVGLSIDGPKTLHDEYRLSKAGKSTFDEVVRAFKKLREYRIQYSTLTVVNRLNAKFPEETYDFLTQELESTFIHFLPCVEPKDFKSTAPQHWEKNRLPVLGSSAARPGTPDSIVTEWSVDPNDWGTFLCRTFDMWLKRDLGRVAVSWFETAIGQSMGQPALMCVVADVCGRAVAIEHNGDVYSCDHYVYPEFKLGNIRDISLSDMVYSADQRRFGYNKKSTLPSYCKNCEYLSLCHGECPKNRLIKSPEGQEGLNYLCSGFKHFYSHAAPQLHRIANGLKTSIAN